MGGGTPSVERRCSGFPSVTLDAGLLGKGASSEVLYA